LERAGQQGIERAKTVVTAVRMFLRFLIAIGRCQPGLDHAIPTMAHWRLSALPRYVPAEAVERVLRSCDVTTGSGLRDRAVLLLLAGLGLRAGDVAALQWCDINCRDADAAPRGLLAIDWRGAAPCVCRDHRPLCQGRYCSAPGGSPSVPGGGTMLMSHVDHYLAIRRAAGFALAPLEGYLRSFARF